MRIKVSLLAALLSTSFTANICALYFRQRHPSSYLFECSSAHSADCKLIANIHAENSNECSSPGLNCISHGIHTLLSQVGNKDGLTKVRDIFFKPYEIQCTSDLFTNFDMMRECIISAHHQFARISIVLSDFDFQEHSLALFEALSESRKVVSLSFIDATLSSEDFFPELVNFLKKDEILESLEFTGMRVIRRDDNISDLFLKNHNKALSRIIFRDISHTPAPVSEPNSDRLLYFLNLLQENKAGERIEGFGWARIEPPMTITLKPYHVDAIVTTMPNLRELDISNQRIHITEIKDMLAKLKYLQNLNIGGSMAPTLAPIVECCKMIKNLQVLKISALEIDPEPHLSFKPLMELKELENLTSLDVSDNILETKGKNSLSALKYLSHLKEISLTGSKFSVAAFSNLGDWNNLSILDVSRCDLTKQHLETIQELPISELRMRENPKLKNFAGKGDVLKKLDVVGCNIGVTSIKQILKTFRALEELIFDVTEENLDCRMVDILIEAMKNHSPLKKLTILLGEKLESSGSDDLPSCSTGSTSSSHSDSSLEDDNDGEASRKSKSPSQERSSPEKNNVDEEKKASSIDRLIFAFEQSPHIRQLKLHTKFTTKEQEEKLDNLNLQRI